MFTLACGRLQLWHSRNWKWVWIKENSLDSHPIHLSLVRHLGIDLQHCIKDSTNPPCSTRTLHEEQGALQELQNIRNSALRPQGWAMHIPRARNSQLPCPAPHPGSPSHGLALLQTPWGNYQRTAKTLLLFISFFPKIRGEKYWPSSRSLQVTILPLIEFKGDFGFWKSTKKKVHEREIKTKTN